MSNPKRVVAFGELMLRLSAPDHELLLQSPQLEVSFGGAEANVAVALAQFGAPAAFVSVLPDNRLGAAALAELRKYGVDTGGVITQPGRMGVYYLTPGAGLRPSEVLYDRAGSAFAAAAPDRIDWRQTLAGAEWLVLSGITPAIGPNAAEAALRAAEAAAELGVKVVFDGNYRAKLWEVWQGDGPGILRRLLGFASLAFADDRDIALILGQSFEIENTLERRRAAAKAAFAAFPKLERIVATRRIILPDGGQDLSAHLFTREAEAHAPTRRISEVVGRIGGGDAFAAGVIYGLYQDWPDAQALAFGLATAALKHGLRGDFCPFSVADVEAAMRDGGADVRR